MVLQILLAEERSRSYTQTGGRCLSITVSPHGPGHKHNLHKVKGHSKSLALQNSFQVHPTECALGTLWVWEPSTQCLTLFSDNKGVKDLRKRSNRTQLPKAKANQTRKNFHNYLGEKKDSRLKL